MESPNDKHHALSIMLNSYTIKQWTCRLRMPPTKEAVVAHLLVVVIVWWFLVDMHPSSTCHSSKQTRVCVCAKVVFVTVCPQHLSCSSSSQGYGLISSISFRKPNTTNTNPFPHPGFQRQHKSRFHKPTHKTTIGVLNVFLESRISNPFKNCRRERWCRRSWLDKNDNVL